MSTTGEGSGYNAEAYRLEEGSTGGRDTKKRNGRAPHLHGKREVHTSTHTRDHHHHPGGPPPPPSAFSSKTKEAQLGGLTTNNTNIT